MSEKCGNKSKEQEALNYQRTSMQKELVIRKLKAQGYRITKQRLMLLDVILEENCTSCKEIYYRASKLNPRIGTATVYRLVNLLEEIGAISRKNIYKIACGMECGKENVCIIELDDDTDRQLSGKNWNTVVLEGLKACGYIKNQRIRSVVVQPCES